jgi:hypothetical protein
MIRACRQSTGHIRGAVLMTNRSRTLVPGALLLVAALFVAACGGGAATATPSPTTEPGAEATPTTLAEATPTATVALEATPDLAIPSFDLEALKGAIPGVDSYRTSVSIGGLEQYQSVVVTAPVLSKSITILDEGEVSQRMVIIGEEAWIASGADGEFEAAPAGLASSMLLAYDPAMMLGGFASVDWATGGLNQGVEEKNGVQAHHVRIDGTTMAGAAAQMPAGSAIDIWVADAGYLVAWEMSGFPEDANFSIQVTGVNDSANKVERPS